MLQTHANFANCDQLDYFARGLSARRSARRRAAARAERPPAGARARVRLRGNEGAPRRRRAPRGVGGNIARGTATAACLRLQEVRHVNHRKYFLVICQFDFLDFSSCFFEYPALNI